MDEAAEFLSDILKQCFELSLMGITIPERFGGQEGSFFSTILAVEAIATVDASAAVLLDVQNTLVNSALLGWGSDDQQQRFLPQLAKDAVGAYCLSEAGSGSNAFALATRALRESDGYRITGRKLWISNAREAGLFLVFANVTRMLATAASPPSSSSATRRD